MPSKSKEELAELYCIGLNSDYFGIVKDSYLAGYASGLNSLEMKGLIDAVKNIRNNPDQWRLPKGPQGADKYAGLPPGFRKLDEALQAFQSKIGGAG